MADNIIYDICIIGGGINGVGIARDAAGRGLKVLLCEQGDLAMGTSSASTKLVHGGLRYLELYEFRLVREALKEREVLLGLAPHIIWPLKFVLPHQKHLRPQWLIRLGLLLYDYLGGRTSLPKSHFIKLNAPWLKPFLTQGFDYADCWVDDARLVIENAKSAAQHGATILTHTKFLNATPQDDMWQVQLSDRTIMARSLVNAAGPWFNSVAAHIPQALPTVRLIKGSHIIVPKLFEGNHAYILQNPDKRIMFAIPYESRFTLIGTTDVELSKDANLDVPIKISNAEIDYLCTHANHYFVPQITAQMVVHSYAGVRALYDDNASDARQATRDYKLLCTDKDTPPYLAVYGGKITTFRELAEKATNLLCQQLLSKALPWTKTQNLCGGDFAGHSLADFTTQLCADYPDYPNLVLQRYARTYGSNSYALLANGLGMALGDDLYSAEIDYVCSHEWAKTADDILWRRTKLGLHVSDTTKDNLANYLQTIIDTPV